MTTPMNKKLNSPPGRGKTKVILGLAVVFSLGLLIISQAQAAPIAFTYDTLVTLDSVNYTVRTDSEATTIIVTGTTIEADVPTGSYVKIISSNGYKLTNNGSLTTTCAGATSYVTIAAGTDVTVTPDKTIVSCTGDSSGGGGGGGGGGGSSPDVTPPTNTTISIAAGASEAPSTAVTLTLGAVGASDMMLANDSTFVGSTWEVYAVLRNWTLTTGNGTKTVYVKFRDAAGNISAPVSDTITLNTTIPEQMVPEKKVEPKPELQPVYEPGVNVEERATKITQVVTQEKAQVTTINKSLVSRLKGRILLQTQEKGEAWYVDPISSNKFYLADGTSAYTALRKFGLGITNADLARIPTGTDARFVMDDSDADGLPDKLEEALGTDKLKADTDGDGVSDANEVLKNGTNPLGAGKSSYSSSLVNRLKGRILLQTQSRGEAWYVNPVDGKKYYLANGPAAYQIMRFLSLGITNTDLRKIGVGELAE